jgi:hypothetical protein
MLKWKNVAYLLMSVMLGAGCAGTISNVSRSADPATSSIVIGHLTGTRHPLPGFFYMVDVAYVEKIEILDFQIVSEDGLVKGFFRPDTRSYFAKEIPPGTYTLRRHRRDRPSYQGDKYINIVTFRVEPGTLVNLGTIKLILEGPPQEDYYSIGNRERGKYIYSYHYERMSGGEAYKAPLARFRQKRPDVYDRYLNRMQENRDEVTSEFDSSFFELIGSTMDIDRVP